MGHRKFPGPKAADGYGVGTLKDAAPIFAAAAGLAGGHGPGVNLWGLLKEAIRHREAVRTEREQHAGLVALVERLSPGSRLVVRQGPSGRRSMEVRIDLDPCPPAPDRCGTP
ncbi:hypothetical protein ACFV5G_12435 [Streptomyces sp. NPDC059766]|uniref:hypothetical protein n=1 Tax=Streptomyces sp. NPDC059766 TaxID=3346940 RepID=UPI003658719A